MSDTVSTANDAIGALLTLIKGLPECAAPVVVSDGFPGTDLPATVVTVGGTAHATATGSQKWATLGARSKDETYDISCVISASQGGTDQSGARQAAWTIFQAIGAALRSDYQLGGIVQWAEIGKWALTQSDYQDAASGRMATIEFSVSCAARI